MKMGWGMVKPSLFALAREQRTSEEAILES